MRVDDGTGKEPLCLKVCRGVAACCLGLFTVAVLVQFSARFILDDAFMFVRYADRLLSEGRLSWNPGGPPTYGITSPLYLGIVVPLRLLFSENAALAAQVSSLLAGVLFLGLFAILLASHLCAGRTVKRCLMVMSVFPLAVSAKYLSGHFVTGMETTFALAYLTGYILLAKTCERGRSAACAVWLGVLGGLAFSARPDLLLYAFGVPISMAVLGPESETRRRGWLVLCVTGATAVGQLLVAMWYFDSPLPLPFYAKGLGLYSDHMISLYRVVPTIEFLTYFASYWFLFLIIGADLYYSLRAGRSGISPVEAGLLGATVAFLIYYLFFVLQIMPYHQRFYTPTLPAVLFLALQSAARLIGRIPETAQRAFRSVPRPVVLLAGVFLLGFLLQPAKWVARTIRIQLPDGTLGAFDVEGNYRNRWTDLWFRLDAFSRLPNDAVFATTEVGCASAMNPQRVIVDLTGLNETGFAHRGFSAERLFADYRPDMIYMPHPHYRRIHGGITHHPHFADHYEHFPAATLGTTLGVALRRDSPYYSDMRRIVMEGLEAGGPEEAGEEDPGP
jgi:hypothetical protein